MTPKEFFDVLRSARGLFIVSKDDSGFILRRNEYGQAQCPICYVAQKKLGTEQLMDYWCAYRKLGLSDRFASAVANAADRTDVRRPGYRNTRNKLLNVLGLSEISHCK